ncbi:MAG: N-acetyltransferase, partial [Desulfurellales bacterium]
SFAAEMGGWQFYTKPGAIWLVLFDANDVAGFCSIIPEKTHLFFDNFYIRKEWRGRGLSNILHDARIEFAKKTGREIRVISDNPIQIKKYLSQGFVADGMRGRYSKFKYHAPNRNQNARID